jgi:hypothetical protein
MFLSNGALLMVCMPDLEAEGPATTQLRRPYFGMHRMEWSDSEGVEFHLPHGEMLRLLRDSGFEVEDLVELRPPEGATTRYDTLATVDWARQWPSEEVWKARKRAT